MTTGAKKPVRMSIDAMGGDHAPGEIVKGAVQAAKSFGIEMLLVGPKKEIEQELASLDTKGLPLSIVEATDVVKDGESPTAVMRKPNSSMAMAVRLVKEGKTDAAVSAGSTGALMVCAFQYLGSLPGIERPLVGGNFIGLAPKTVVMDLGANVGCQPYYLLTFAIAGCVYAKSFLGVENPTVGLLNVGAEEGKGNDQVKEAYNLLKKSGLNFIGNVEGMDIPRGKANVIVCDGFVGNILVKFSEGLGRLLSHWLSKELQSSLPAAELDNVSNKLLRLVSAGELVGGGPLIGINGVVAKVHGRAEAPQIVNTIEQAKIFVETAFVSTLRAELEKISKTISI